MKIDATGLQRCRPFRDDEGRYLYWSPSPHGRRPQAHALTHAERVKLARARWLAREIAPGTEVYCYRDRGHVLGWGIFGVRRLWLSRTCLAKEMDEVALTLAHEMIHNSHGELRHGDEFDRLTYALHGKMRHVTRSWSKWGVNMSTLRHTEHKPKVAALRGKPTLAEKWAKELESAERLEAKWAKEAERAEKFRAKYEKKIRRARTWLAKAKERDNGNSRG